MTREEERLEQAKFYNSKGVKDPHVHFLRGTEWADSTMIYKACKWLKDYAHMYVSETTGDLNESDLINAFRKAMKGE